MLADPWAQAEQILYPPDPTGERADPIEFAVRRSRGMYQRYRHVEVINDAVQETIDTGGRLILSVSVRHSKSETVSKWRTAHYIGTNPDKRVILACHEAGFAARWGRAARDILTEHGPDVFGVTVSQRSAAANRWDIEGHEGGMLTVGVGGSPIGRGADLMIVDDPIKSYADAMSPLTRERVKEWWTGTMASRVEPDGAVILIMARWHEDDLAGFLLREDPESWRELRMPAICDDPVNDPLGRQTGEPAWPERWPVKALKQRKRDVTLSLGEVVWLAQYQQTPKTPDGGMFPEDRWEFVSTEHVDWGQLRWVRAWDLAATKDGGDWTVGVLMARLADGRFLVRDVRRGQWAPDEVRWEIKQATADDPVGTRVELPQDPGQAGKDQAQQLIRLVAGKDANADPVTGSKEVRATGLAAQQRARNVLLWEAEWNGLFVAELKAFPKGRHDDQVDAAATGFNVLADDDGVVEEQYNDQRLSGRR